nr:hypothetical protein Iba_chr04cCG14470 [Ipomoea batatas]
MFSAEKFSNLPKKDAKAIKGAICDEVQLEGGPPREEMPHFHFLEKTRKKVCNFFYMGCPWQPMGIG